MRPHMLLALFCFGSCQAATTLTNSAGRYTLKMDYLTVLAGSSKLAYKASLTSTDLQTFSVDLSSVAAVTTDSSADPAVIPQLVIAGGKYTLEIPSLAVSGKNYAVSLSSVDLSRFSVDASSLKTLAGNAPTGVAASNVNSQTVGGRSIASTTQLTVSWTAPSGAAVSSYKITARESDGVNSVSAVASANETSTTLKALKASTKYQINVTACLDSTCTSQATAAAVSATTPDEYWQLQGSGTGYSGVTKVVSDGTSLSWVMRWGSEAGTANSGRYQYYYKANATGRTGIGIANTSKSDISVATLASFTANTAAGLRNPCNSPESPFTDCPSIGAGYFINAIQAVPLAKEGKVRVYFEAIDAREPNQPTRIYSLDSQDGLIGLDFNSSASLAYCGGTGSTDYAAGNNCAPKVEMGVSTDSAGTQAPFTAARQFKIGWDWLTDWRWDGAAGTFMIITGDDACGLYRNSLFYAAWNGSQWIPVTDSKGCARPLVSKAHGPVVVPLGGARFKVYYEDETNGTQSGKPLRFIYSDGSLTGTGSVEMDDWESSAKARDVHFLWPDGSLLDAQDEAGLGDHMVLTPAGTLDQQFMYVNLGGFDNSKWKAASSGLGLAVLLNP